MLPVRSPVGPGTRQEQEQGRKNGDREPRDQPREPGDQRDRDQVEKDQRDRGARGVSPERRSGGRRGRRPRRREAGPPAAGGRPGGSTLFPRTPRDPLPDEEEGLAVQPTGAAAGFAGSTFTAGLGTGRAFAAQAPVDSSISGRIPGEPATAIAGSRLTPVARRNGLSLAIGGGPEGRGDRFNVQVPLRKRDLDPVLLERAENGEVELAGKGKRRLHPRDRPDPQLEVGSCPRIPRRESPVPDP